MKDRELSPILYWYYEGLGALQDVNADSEVVHGRFVHRSDAARFRIPKTALADRAAKEEGYRRAVQVHVLELLPDYTLGPAERQLNLSRLQALTGESLTNGAAWLRWWARNRGRLRLSRDGRRLVIRE